MNEFDGLWTISFSTAEESYAGVVVREDIERGGVFVLIDGRVYGGGVSYFFVGKYSKIGPAIEMQVTAIRYNEIVTGIFGNESEIQLVFSGSVAAETMVLHGHVLDNPGKRLDLMAVRRSSPE